MNKRIDRLRLFFNKHAAYVLIVIALVLFCLSLAFGFIAGLSQSNPDLAKEKYDVGTFISNIGILIFTSFMAAIAYNKIAKPKIDFFSTLILTVALIFIYIATYALSPFIQTILVSHITYSTTLFLLLFTFVLTVVEYTNNKLE